MDATERCICSYLHNWPEDTLRQLRHREITGEFFAEPGARVLIDYALARDVFEPSVAHYELVFLEKKIPPDVYVALTDILVGSVTLGLPPLLTELKKRHSFLSAQAVATRLQMASKDQDRDAFDAANEQLREINLSILDRRPVKWKDAVDMELERATNPTESKDSEEHFTLPWPWPSFDKRHGKFHRGELCVIGAGPSIGKSSLMRQIMLWVAQKGYSSMMVSLEVSQPEVVKNMATSICGLPWKDFASLREGEKNDFRMALRQIRALPVRIVDDISSLAGVEAAVESAHKDQFIDLLCIDYLGLIRDCAGNRDSTKASNTGQVAAAFKNLAKKLNCVVLLGCQINRSAPKDSRPPAMHDLKDSGDIEAHADRVLLLHRPTTDAVTKLEQKLEGDIDDVPRFYQEIIQAKGRNVGTTWSSCYLRRQCARFELGA